MQKILKVLLFLLGIFVYIINAHALDVNLSIDKNETDINDYISLTLKLESFTGGEIQIGEIKGIENFDIINQNSSRGTSSSMLELNGKREMKVKSIYNINFTLKGKKKGDYELGPVEVISSTEKQLTNIVKVKVTGDKLFVNNNHLDLSTVKPKVKTDNSIKSKKETIKKETTNEIEENIEKKDFSNNNKYYLLLFLIFITIIGFFISKQSISNKINNSTKKIKTDDNKINKENKEIKETKASVSPIKEKSKEELEQYYSKYKK